MLNCHVLALFNDVTVLITDIMGYLINVDACKNSCINILTFNKGLKITQEMTMTDYELHLLDDDECIACSISSLTPDGSR